jgi:uncharacterized protein (DUF305 family)
MTSLRIFIVCAGALTGAGCSDQSSSELRRLEAEVQELTLQVRAYRGEVQRSTEKMVTLLQGHALGSEPFSVAGQQPPAASMSPDPSFDAGRALTEAQTRMSKGMASVPLTGDPDRDFVAQMIPHHQGAVEMSRVVLQAGKRPDVKAFGQQIIAHQQAEIELMKQWLATWPQ